MTLYVDLYVENTKESTRKLLELTNKLSKVSDYKINMQKSIVFLYSCYEQTKHESKKTILLTMALRRIKYVGINLTREGSWPGGVEWKGE